MRQREAAEANLELDLHDGMVFNQIDRGALLQPKIRVRNRGTNDAPIHDWRAVLRIGDEQRQLDHLIGQQPLSNSHQVPFLDRIGPLPPGLTTGHLHFVIPGISQDELNRVLEETNDAVVLSVTAYGPVQQWAGELDLRAKYEGAHRTVAARSPVEQLRVLSRDGHALAQEVPKMATPAQLARIEPRVDQLAGCVRELLVAHHPEFLGDLDAIAAYVPASLNGATSGVSVNVYPSQLLGVVDHAIHAAG